MMPTRNGSFHLFRLFGIDVYLHWLWFLAAIYNYTLHGQQYRSPVFAVAEYLGLFLLVLLHEFGHALACRQTGGQADQVVLWPLGGVAYVAPPQRAGAQLWSIVAGPLVNFVFLFLFPIFRSLFDHAGITEFDAPDTMRLLRNLTGINIGLLIFNLLPIYPLDGGQIVRSLLWFVLGRARSLLVAAGIGFLGAAVLGVAVLVPTEMTEGILGTWVNWVPRTAFGYVMIFFLLSSATKGWQQARALMVVAAAPRHHGLACPKCHVAPPAAPFWRCARCQQTFDMFAHATVCPHCQAHYAEAQCLECGVWSPPEAWRAAGRIIEV